jgi:hypothetical protein
MISEELYRQVEFELVERFGGVTMIEQRNPTKSAVFSTHRHKIPRADMVSHPPHCVKADKSHLAGRQKPDLSGVCFFARRLYHRAKRSG